ncbi:MAG TPA: glycosyltransferase family 39 protein, partial [Acidimicrobiia bacterium]|nr:glycosyltransferase family 39 protein [Acidimicrobiia bacterium]
VSTLVLAVYLAWRLAGAIGAVATAVLLLATPLVWDLVPTLRVDLPQAVCIPIALLLLARPDWRRWLLAGLVIGIAISLKESALALVLVPLAWLPGTPWRRWLRLAGWFAVGVVLTAAWWWIWVWFAKHRIWPAPTLDTISNRGFDIPAPSGARLWTWVAILALGVLLCALRFRRNALGRGVVLTAVLLLPSAWYTLTNDQETRNYVGLAVIGCVATGVAVASVIRAAMRSLARRPRGRLLRNAFAVSVALIAIALALGSQITYRGKTMPQEASASAAGYVRSELKAPARVVSAFRDRSYFGVQLRDEAKVARIVSRVDPARGLDGYVWVGRRGFTTFGLTRDSLIRSLGNRATQFLVIAQPHPLSPAELVPALAGTPAFPEARRFSDATETTDVLRVSPSQVASVAQGLGVHMSVTTAFELLPELGADRLLSARPTVAGDAAQLDSLRSSLGVPICTRPGPTPTLVQFEPQGPGQPCPS